MGSGTTSRATLLLYRLLLGTRPSSLAAATKRLLGIRRRVQETSEGAFFLDPCSNFGMALLVDGRYEPQMITVLNSFLKPGDTFVDVGANEGYFSVLAAQRVGPSGRVLSVEPQRRLRSVLERNFELNGLRNVTVADSAVSDRAGRVDLFISPDTNTGSTGLLEATRFRLRTESVETVTLAALLERHGIERADLLKMDIEGSEYEALLGSPDLFTGGRVRAIALELHPALLERRGRTPEPMLEMLRRGGYTRDRRFENLVFTRAGD